jgi:hypothetical protein
MVYYDVGSALMSLPVMVKCPNCGWTYQSSILRETSQERLEAMLVENGEFSGSCPHCEVRFQGPLNQFLFWQDDS